MKGEAEVAFKGLIAAATSIAMVTAPTVAAAQTTSATVAAAQEVAPAGETVNGEQLRGGFIIPLIALIAIILGLCVGTDICGGDDDDLPHSP
jgi:hypothetical protein